MLGFLIWNETTLSGAIKNTDMDIDDMKKETRYWQRLLRFGGYYTGQIDGIRGKLQMAAEAQWDAEQKAVREKFGVLDDRSEGNLATILPKAQEALRGWLSRAIPQARDMGYTLKVICGTRSYDEQNELYAKGRTKPGSRVTNARGGYSNHNFGIAIDIGLFDAETGAYMTKDTAYDKLAELVPPPESVEWGGSWRSLHDAPHYQFRVLDGSTAALRNKFNA